MPLRGADQRQDLQDKVFVDTRTLFERADEICLEHRELVPMAITALAVCAFFVPIFTVPCLLAGFIAYTFGTGEPSLPLFMPQQDPRARFPRKGQKLEGLRDRRDRVSEDMQAPYARGIFYLGTLRGRRRSQAWITDSALRQHHVLFGTSGAGKTEALLGFAFNSLCWGSGLAFFDGKGTTELYMKLYATASLFGRQEDILVLNWMTSNQDLTIKTPERVSNTTAIYTVGSSPFLTELTASLMPEAGSDGIWKDRAIALVSALTYVLTFDRDKYNKPFSPSTLRQNLSIQKIVEYSKRKDLPPVPKAAVDAYLRSLPGFVASKGAAQESKTLEQHGYLEMQFTKIMATLSDTYGHIFDRLYGEVSMVDVVLNNRILVLLLPSLEKSGHESRGLGVLGMTLMRAMMAQMMGFKVEGSAYQNVEALATRASFPFYVLYDELGYYMPKDGTAIQAAQGRSLGLSIVIAAQDRTKLDEQSSTETSAIIGTTRWKHAMAIENKPTFDVYTEQAGQADVAVKAGLTRDRGALDDSYRTDEGVRFDRRDRISVADLRGQRQGQGITLFEQDVVRLNYFYADVPHAGLTNVAINQFLEIGVPALEEIVRTTTEWHAELVRLRSGLAKLKVSRTAADELIGDIVANARIASHASRKVHEQAATALGLMLLKRASRQPPAAETAQPPLETSVPAGEIFAPSEVELAATELPNVAHQLTVAAQPIQQAVEPPALDANLDDLLYHALSAGLDTVAPASAPGDAERLPAETPREAEGAASGRSGSLAHAAAIGSALRAVANANGDGASESALITMSQQAIEARIDRYDPEPPKAGDIPDVDELERIIAGLRTVNHQ